ncbi:MAG: NAD(P)-dependent alcohol dehydrogenase [Schumannella sp.]
MRAAGRTEYGSADVIRIVDVPLPEPGPHQVRVRVEAAGVDIGVWHMMTGLPTMARLAIGFGRPRSPVLGAELAGVVDAVGTRVTRFRPGDAVFGVGAGSFAEYALSTEKQLVPLPDGVTAQHAAASAVSGVTAHQALVREGRIAAGHRVLILGASGGVGSFAVQIAKALGARVTGVASGAKLDFVRGLGADETLDYATTDATDGSRAYDLVLEMGGLRPLRVLRRSLAPTGRAIIVGGEGGGRVTGGFLRGMTAGIASAPHRRKVTGLVSVTTASDLAAVGELIASGAVVPAIQEVLPLDALPDALRSLESHQVRGKLVIDPTR